MDDCRPDSTAGAVVVGARCGSSPGGFLGWRLVGSSIVHLSNFSLFKPFWDSLAHLGAQGKSGRGLLVERPSPRRRVKDVCSRCERGKGFGVGDRLLTGKRGRGAESKKKRYFKKGPRGVCYESGRAGRRIGELSSKHA